MYQNGDIVGSLWVVEFEGPFFLLLICILRFLTKTTECVVNSGWYQRPLAVERVDRGASLVHQAAGGAPWRKGRVSD